MGLTINSLVLLLRESGSATSCGGMLLLPQTLSATCHTTGLCLRHSILKFTAVLCKAQGSNTVLLQLLSQMSTKPLTSLSNHAATITVTFSAEVIAPTRNILLSSSLQSFLELCFQGTLNLFWPTKHRPVYWPVSTCSMSQLAN